MNKLPYGVVNTSLSHLHSGKFINIKQHLIMINSTQTRSILKKLITALTSHGCCQEIFAGAQVL